MRGKYKKTITGLYKAPGKPIETRTVENSLEALQQLVGGYIETFTIATDCVIICDEEGKLKGKPANFSFAGELFVGPVFICGAWDGDFTDLRISAQAQNLLTREIRRNDRFEAQRKAK